jgi:hypothetical protein
MVGNVADPRELVTKVKGMLTDHAEDQKKLVRLFRKWKEACEREVRGERALATLPPDDVVALLWQMTDGAIVAAGGIEGWEALPAEERDRRSSEAQVQLHAKIGQERFSMLTMAEQESIDFFVWAGCCMHKDLNAVKGGNTRMQAWWALNDVDGPALLMNRDNAAAALGGPSTAQARAVRVSQGGAAKALALAGSVFRHKDDKKGQQDSLRFFLEAQLGYFSPWPDTSNTRYHSNCDGAGEWIVHEDLYIVYLQIIMDRKDARTHTNIEQNIYCAFRCDKTKQEMACFSTWGQCISHPYFRAVRNSSGNILDLGPLHEQLIAHIKKLIDNVELVFGTDATYETAAFDGQPFERPEAFYIIHKIPSPLFAFCCFPGRSTRDSYSFLSRVCCQWCNRAHITRDSKASSHEHDERRERGCIRDSSSFDATCTSNVPGPLQCSSEIQKESDGYVHEDGTRSKCTQILAQKSSY